MFKFVILLLVLLLALVNAQTDDTDDGDDTFATKYPKCTVAMAVDGMAAATSTTGTGATNDPFVYSK